MTILHRFINPTRVLISSLTFGTLCLLAAPNILAQQAVQSDAFVDSVGVNLHLHSGNTLYQTNYPLIRSSLVTLGVRHVRDGFIQTTWQPYYDRFQELGQLGIKGIFTTGPDVPTSVLQSWPLKVPASFEAYENANEFDVNNANWLALLQSGMPTIYSAAKTGANYTVAAPTLVIPGSSLTLGNMSRYVDVGNIHDYFSNFNPGTAGWGDNGYGSIPYNLALAARVSGSKPVWATETGYNNDSRSSSFVDETVASTYIPRLLLEHWNAGITRTYLYELATSSTDQDYGLLRMDGSQKPAFKAVANLLNLLSDKGSAFTPSQLDYTIQGAPATVHKLLLQKRDGTFYLALWNEVPVYDPYKHIPIAVAPQAVTLHSSHALGAVSTYQWTATGDVATASLAGGTDLPLVVTDKILLVKMKLQNSVTLTSVAVPSTGGTVTAAPGSTDGNYAAGTSVVLTATPNAGYIFSGYSGDVTGAGTSATLLLNSNATVSANFTACSYKLGSTSVSASGGALSFTSTAGVRSVPYSTSAGCNATPTVSASWMGATASNGVLSISVARNTAAPRQGTILLGNATLTVLQSGSGKLQTAQ